MSISSFTGINLLLCEKKTLLFSRDKKYIYKLNITSNISTIINIKNTFKVFEKEIYFYFF